MVGWPLPEITLECTAGAVKYDVRKTRGRELWRLLPQAGGSLFAGMGQDGWNYRPVSLTSVICKLLETLIKDPRVDLLGITYEIHISMDS